MRTMQATFDEVAAHLLAQQARAVSGIECRYRAGNLKCAIGCLIPDSEYDPLMEGEVIGPATYIGAALTRLGYIPAIDDFVEGIAQPEVRLLVELQCVHDTVPVNLWKAHLAGVAESFGLDPASVKQ